MRSLISVEEGGKMVPVPVMPGDAPDYWGMLLLLLFTGIAG
jgi:hypothetical protein